MKSFFAQQDHMQVFRSILSSLALDTHGHQVTYDNLDTSISVDR